MPLNELARRKLRELRRGDTLPYRSVSSIVLCPACKFPNRYPRKKCQKCREKVPARPEKKCRLCEEQLTGRNICWCNGECFSAYLLLTDASYLRSKVYDRDKGICKECGLDCAELKRRLQAMEPMARREAYLVLTKAGFNCTPYSSDTLWDAHHVIGLDEGGSWELSNVETRCHPCHKEKTAEQAARRGKQRKLLGVKWRSTRRAFQIQNIGGVE